MNRAREEFSYKLIVIKINKVLRRCRCMCRYPEPDEFKVEVTYTYWVSYSRQAYTQNVQDTSINLSIGRGLDVLANTLETVLV